MTLDPDLAAHAYRPRSRIEEILIWGLTAVLCCGYFIAVVRHGAGLVRMVLKFFFPDTEENEEWKAVVHYRMLELRVSRMRIYLLLVSCVALPWVVALVVEMAHGSFPKISTPGSEISWLVFLAASALVIIKPALLTPRNLDAASLFVVAHAVIQETPFVCCTEQGFHTSRSWSQLTIMMGLSVVRGLGSWRETLVLALGNMVFIGVMTYTRWSASRSEETWGSLADRAVLWGLLVALAMVLGAVIDTGYRQLVTQGLQLAEAREMHKAATALLRSCYDVVVELDSSGSLDGDSQDLGSLLLRSNHHRSMRGVQMADLIVNEEDRRKFQDRLAASRTKTVGLAENMHVTMKDGLGNTLHMEMMWFACKRAEGGVHFIVGIREFGDRTQEPHGTPDFFPLVASSPSEASSSSDGTVSLSQSEYVDLDTDQAIVVVNINQQSCPIRSTTTGFRTQVGYIPRNAPLSRLVKKPQHMMHWLQHAANSLVHGIPLPPDYDVSLRMPQGNLRACCRLVMTDKDADMPDVDVENVVVLFYNITQSRSRHAGSRGGVSGTPAYPSPGPSGTLTL